jgi:hypothetical protein
MYTENGILQKISISITLTETSYFIRQTNIAYFSHYFARLFYKYILHTILLYKTYIQCSSKYISYLIKKSDRTYKHFSKCILHDTELENYDYHLVLLVTDERTYWNSSEREFLWPEAKSVYNMLRHAECGVNRLNSGVP